MKQVFMTVMAVIIGAGVVIAHSQTEISVNSMPPVVVKTFPQAGDIFDY